MQRRRFKDIIATLLGLALIGLVEITLQMLGIGPANRLFLLDNTVNPPSYRLNPLAAQRFFQHQYVRLASTQSQFTEQKPPKTKRIFVLGASTLLGFPNPPATAFPNYLELMLKDLFPSHDFEVINCGITAINSFCLRDFTDELVKYEPDLLLVYAGHNEFVGPYGVTTPFLSVGNNYYWIRFNMWLQRSKLYHFTKKALTYLNFNSSTKTNKNQGFGLHLVRKEVANSSTDFTVTMANFRRNLQAIFTSVQGQSIPIILSTLVANEQGFYPLRSEGTPDVLSESPQIRAGWSLSHWLHLLKSNSYHAALHFEAAEAHLQAQHYDQAQILYAKARDLDTIRLRAGTPFNQLLKNLASSYPGVFLVDSEAVFRQASPHGIIGNSLITEHLHPNVRGHELLARTIASYLASQASIIDLLPAPTSSLATYEAYTKTLGYSPAQRVYYRNDLILFWRKLPYQKTLPTQQRRLAELVELQLTDILKLSYTEIQTFATKGGFLFLTQTLEEISLQDKERLSIRLQDVVKPLGINPYKKP